ncbi:MAG: hypothetical protein ACJ72A_22700 [Nocardioidaceae bacterium]
MLPLPLPNVRANLPLRAWARRANSYTLWAFNPQPPLTVRLRQADPAPGDPHHSRRPVT